MAQQTLNDGDLASSFRGKLNANFTELYGLVGSESSFSFVNSKDDFPDAVAGVITLPAGSSYYLTTLIDLTGDRIVCAGKCALVGSSPEISRITSTGLSSGTPMISSTYSLTLSRIQVEEVGTALSLDASSNSDQALDWAFVNFLNVNTIGTITTYDNFVAIFIAMLNASGMTFAGTFGTVGFSDSLFNSDASGTAISFDASSIITRRIRFDRCAFVILSGETGISLPDAATVPTDGYVLDRVSFSGGGTYLSGVDETSLKADFTGCTSITNTTYAAGYSMQDNSTATTISVAGTAVKIAGTTTANTINQKFTHSDNRLTYVGAKTGVWKIDSPVSFTSGNNKRIGFYIAKNGTVIPTSEMYRTTSGTSAAASLSVQALVQLSTNDYIELWVENETDTTSVTVIAMTPIATEQ